MTSPPLARRRWERATRDARLAERSERQSVQEAAPPLSRLRQQPGSQSVLEALPPLS
ncbi:MAG TPA: hypothetical protein VK548_19830 [Candidatus Acidoferrum sp.]|nr:hypothetical protein [Candidatus Acidoferrum sp.]